MAAPWGAIVQAINSALDRTAYSGSKAGAAIAASGKQAGTGTNTGMNAEVSPTQFEKQDIKAETPNEQPVVQKEVEVVNTEVPEASTSEEPEVTKGSEDTSSGIGDFLK